MAIQHISTQLMIIDSMTKGLPAKLFSDYVWHMGLVRLFWAIIFNFLTMIYIYKYIWLSNDMMPLMHIK